MLISSQDYKDNIFGDSRSIVGKITFDIVNLDAQTTSTPSVNDEQALISKHDEIVTEGTQIYKYATFEPDMWKLDGSFVLPPKVAETGTQIGWIGNTLSSATGGFVSNTSYYGSAIYGVSKYSSTGTIPTLTITLDSPQSSLGLSIAFDAVANEYATDFSITVKKASSTAYSYNVTGNTSNIFIWETALNDYDEVVIQILKTNNPYRRVRIFNVLFGVIKTYTTDDIINMNILEEIDVLSNTIPNNELKFNLLDIDKNFNIITPTGVYAFLQRKQKVQPYLGLVISSTVTEYVKMGIFYLDQWKSKQATIESEFVCTDALGLLQESYFNKSVYGSITLYDLAEDILLDAGIVSYNIDTALQSITTTGYLPIMTHQQAIQQVCIAGMAVIYADRNGYITVKQLVDTVEDKLISFDEVFQIPAIKQEKLYNKITVDVKKYTEDASSTINTTSITLAGTQDVIIKYDAATTISSTLSAGVLNSAVYYTSYAVLNITYTGTTTITTTGKLLKSNDNEYILNNIQNSELEYGLKVTNTLITSNTIAANVASWIYNQSLKRLTYNANYRQDMTLEPTDNILLQNNFGTNSAIKLTKQIFNFNGTLNGSLEGKGI